jgi:hypothetical protein
MFGAVPRERAGRLVAESRGEYEPEWARAAAEECSRDGQLVCSTRADSAIPVRQPSVPETVL